MDLSDILAILKTIFLTPRIADFGSWLIHALIPLLAAFIFWFILTGLFLLLPIRHMDRERRLLVCKQFGLLLTITALFIFSLSLYNFGRLETFWDLTGSITVFLILLIFFAVYYFDFKGYLRYLKKLRIEE